LRFRISSVRDVVFGWNAIEELGEIVGRFGGKAIIITGRNVGRQVVPKHVLPQLEGVHVDVWSNVTTEPDERLVEMARRAVRDGGYDVVIGVGGGSALDVAKLAASLSHSDKPLSEFAGAEVSERESGLVLCPTTAGTGSEVTNLAVVKLEDSEVRRVIECSALQADVAIVDPQLTLSLPKSVTVSSGLDALCHAIESLVSLVSNPFTEMLSMRAMEYAIESLPLVLSENSRGGRERMSLASLFAGMAINNAGTVLGHALGYAHAPLHGKPHGISVAVTMPYVLQYNSFACPEKHVTIARAFGANADERDVRNVATAVGRAFAEFLDELGVPSNLSELGVTERDIPSIVERTFASEKHVLRNPRPVRRKELFALLEKAITGDLDDPDFSS